MAGSLFLWANPQFIRKGGRSGSGNFKSVIGISYLELPLNIRYGMRTPTGGRWTAGFGPYVAYAIGGSTKTTINGQSTKADLFTNGGYNRFDAGLTFGADYWLPSGLYVGLTYDLGLTNLLSRSGVSTKNRSISLNVGYSIRKLAALGKKK
ncbi:outer membrane beta-barrel protein [Nibrella viscosa]